MYEEINKFLLKENIILNNNELDIIYDYINNDIYKVINNPLEVLNDLKDKLSTTSYNKLLALYNKYKKVV